jgi:hypothetical protein
MTLRSFLTLCAALPALSSPAARSQEPPAQIITTDTLEYCINLQQMVVQRGSRLAEVRRLLVEGKRMCDHGDIREGITRLRQALVISHHHVLSPSADAEAH